MPPRAAYVCSADEGCCIGFVGRKGATRIRQPHPHVLCHTLNFSVMAFLKRIPERSAHANTHLGYRMTPVLSAQPPITTTR